MAFEKLATLIGLLGIFVWYTALLDKDITKTPKELLKEYDFIVVGGGSAGCALASRLSEQRDKSVLLLEAGDSDLWYSHIPGLVPFNQLSQIDWQLKTERQKHACLGMKNNTCLWPRGKVLGGTSVLNYMMHVRGLPADYNWGSEWSWEKVLPYFNKLETVYDTNEKNRGTSGPIEVQYSTRTPFGRSFMEAATSGGFEHVDDYNVNPTIGWFNLDFICQRISMYDLICKPFTGILTSDGQKFGMCFGVDSHNLSDLSIDSSGKRSSTASKYIRPVMHRENLHIVKGAHVLKVNFNSEKRAVGVDYLYKGVRHSVGVKGEVILSAGAIHSPHILLLSGIGPKKHLEEHKIQIDVVVDSGNVGRHLMDHVVISNLYEVNDSNAVIDSTCIYNPFILFKEIYNFVVHGTGIFTQIGIELVGLGNTKIEVKNSVKTESQADLQYYVGPTDVFMEGYVAEINFNLKQETLSAYYGTSSKGSPKVTLITVLQQPESKGYIELRSSDPLQNPKIDPNYLSKESDVHKIREGLKVLDALMHSDDLKKYSPKLVTSAQPGCAEHPFMSDEYIDCSVRHRANTLYHPMGTCRIADNINNGVVDQHFRVFGVDGLRVVDASVFPNAISGNTNIPTIMLAERAAQWILQQNL